ncbi:leucine zipper putative tumor suppressor 3-like isoform X1 [Topomyia yanbarensis]|uniref:leucine zipper putative tumor suppressor 3-like isoform X1 n=1 Tax=Topomyia yanbarensis TaxID=2498891 RepID=UPI00273B2A83|nr:leucine zipper putative tumor suppressor 3-like isoform X1 [Topomyia yanbarensis]XP_058839421.1 leucine zipper putative tumor suppressor 3-like isoform X1 [Topomyia yanbarensis]XP_058839422.1 leucine zipper putative tumor suppressor 3-like isoform X1 [Topomyia yanbarensis]XP_058839423.1 leucine zipper putative tumor suppressor 3-like isoform X1 [Topomyia yanbarensis]XP_058839424.1 leucine zipper putative tumor suppressor 3-like isoform X1 [Topomyia yanbarensis]XP_058839425.1 leucine zipper 
MESSHNGASSSLVIAPSPCAYKSPIRPKGHYRSSSLENNPFGPAGGKSTLSLVPTSFTGTLKSRREQKRISDFLSKQSLSAASVGTPNSAGGGTITNNNNGRDQSESSIRKAHFENIREIFEKNNSKNAHNSKLAAAAVAKLNGLVAASSSSSCSIGHDMTPGGTLSTEDKPPKIQSCSGILGKGKQVIRPIAFKPVPYKCNTPNYASPVNQNGGRLTDLGERYGSTPSLGPPMSMQYKFSSTTDLHHHKHRHGGDHGSAGVATGSNGLPVGSSGPSSGIYQHQYGILSRKTSSIPFKTYDSLESILKLPDSMIASYPNPSTGSQSSAGMYAAHDLLDMAPSPSDSGISELEAALRDRDSELAYLRQTMEHNEQVIFKVHQDKEKHWEQELNRLKAIHESRLRAGAQKVHKLEQLLMMQTFQLRQDKKRLQEDVHRLHAEFSLAKEQAEQQKSELCQLKLGEKDLKDQNGDLSDEIQMLRRVVSDLKERLEESEWSLCQRNGEVALMKTQLKDAQTEVTTKDQEILQLRSDLKMQNLDEISLKKSEIKKELDFDLEISQLNRIIIFKDQIIVVMNNEIQKLRKELSDISIMRGYEGVPSGRYSRYKKKLDFVAQKFEESNGRGDHNKQTSGDGGAAKQTSESEGVKKKAVGDLSSSEIIRNYFNSKLELNKKLFLNTQICNYSDEDKSSIIETYNAKKLPDITLDLSSITRTEKATSGDELKEGDQSCNQSSSDDDYKSMTPTRDQEEEENENDPPRVLANVETSTKCDNSAPGQEKEQQVVARLRQELQDCRDSFEQERLKWADEKEKVLIYQRQLQQNYVEMCKRTAVLEEKLKTLEKQ